MIPSHLQVVYNKNSIFLRFLVYLKDKIGDKEREKDIHSSTSSFPSHQGQDSAWSKPGASCRSPSQVADLNTWAIFLCFSEVISRVLDQKCDRWEMNQPSEWDAVITDSGFTLLHNTSPLQQHLLTTISIQLKVLVVIMKENGHYIGCDLDSVALCIIIA